MDWAPDHGGVEVLSPGVVGSDDGGFLLESREVLASGIDTPETEETGHLGAQLLIAFIGVVPRGCAAVCGVGIGQPSSAVELQGGVELPFSQSGLVGGCQQAFVFVGEWLLSEHSAIGAFYVGAAIGGCECESLEERVGGLQLPGVRIAVALQIGEVNGMGVAVEIDQQLVLEAGEVILCAELECFLADGDVAAGTDAVVPCSLLVKVFIDDNLSSAGKEKVVFGQHMVGAIAFAC